MGPMTGIYFSSSSKQDGCSPIIPVENHEKFQVPKMELLTYVSCMYYGLWIQPHPQTSLIRYSIFGTWNFWWENVSFSKMRRFLWDDFHPFSYDGRCISMSLICFFHGWEKSKTHIHHMVESKTSPINKSKQSEAKKSEQSIFSCQ